MMQINRPKWEEVSTGVWEFPVPEKYLQEKKGEVNWLFFAPPPVLRIRLTSVKSGQKVRPIYAPNDFSKTLYRERLAELYKIFSEIESLKVAYGFIPNRNVIEQAIRHIHFKYTISLDIRDFFDSIKPKLVKGLIPDEMIPMLFINGAPRQGLPTSPIVANIAFNRVDQEITAYLSTIESLIEKENPFQTLSKGGLQNFEYTRYADDISISINDVGSVDRVINGIQRILVKHGFELNSRKTKLLKAKNGRRVICGVGVDEANVYPTRKTRKKIRAAIHQSSFSSLLGLRSWVSSIEKKQPE
ncbi:reverse transcriptase family protein [Shewanella sp. 10N.286.51.B2]|uniref:reverse transcriptase family protein n=1 Tax=Shewanella sp. 10N.286.51.B2 TaxID=3229707 RepID=UPI0035520DCA